MTIMEKSKRDMAKDPPTNTVKKSHSFPAVTKDQSNTDNENNNDDKDNNDSIAKNSSRSSDFKRSNITSLLLNNESTSFKKLIIKELNIKSNTDEYNNLINGKDEEFDNFVKIKLINNSHEVEKLRSQNLDKLNTLLDKCLENDKLDSIMLNHIFNFINNNNPTNNSGNNSNINLLNRSPSPIHSSASNPPLNAGRKRKLDIPPPNRSPKLASPRGHRRYKSEIPSINEMSFQVYPSGNNTSNQSSYPLQPYQLPAPPIPPNNQQQASTPGWQSNPSYPYQYGPGYSNDSQQQQQLQSQQNMHRPSVSSQGYFPPQLTPMGQPHPQQGYGMPQSRQMLMVPNNENLNPNDNNNNDNSYFNIPPQYSNSYPQQSLGPPAPQASPYRQPQTTKSIRKGHRRSQSANVSLGSHNNSSIDFKTPQIFSNQKPVNFLIHTPKHPPPS